MPASRDTADAHRRDHRWGALAVICIAVVVIILDNTIMNVALPSIERSLGATSSQLQWVVDAYTLVFASLLLTAGTLGDRYGRRGALMVGLVIFGAGSALASSASSAWWLIGFRALMGLGAAAIFPTTLSIITNIFEGRERGRAIGIWAGLSGVGIAAGPIVGGMLLDRFWWGSVLLVNVPIVAIALPLLFFFVPTSKDPHARPVDPAGAGLSVVGLTALLYGIIEAPQRGWASLEVLAALGTGIVVLTLFVAWELHTDEPMLEVSFFSDARFTAASIALSLTFFGLFGFVFLLTQYLQFVEGLSPLAAGLRLAPPALGIAIAAPIAPRVVEHIGTKVVVAAGLVTATVALLLLDLDTVLSSDLWLALVLVLFGFGMGLTMAPATDSIMGSVPRDRAGVGSAVNDTTRQTGGALGVAVLGSLFSTRYTAHIAGLGLPAPVAHVAKQQVAAALQIARRLPPPAGPRLASAARTGFTSGLHLATLTAAGIVLMSAIIVAVWLPARAGDEQANEAHSGARAA